jgi:hypothetical protein
MAALDGKPLSEVKGWLAQSGLKDESLSDWYLEAEDRFGIRSSEDDYLTSDGLVCDHFETWYSNRTERTEVVVGRASGRWVTEHWSEAAVEEDAFYCEISDRHGSYEFRVCSRVRRTGRRCCPTS